MRFADLEASDRRFAVGAGLVAALLLIGLTVTGLWHFVVYRPTPEDIDFFGGQPFLTDRPRLATEIHNTLADLATALAIVVTGWVSYRVLARLSWTALISFIVLAVTVFTGAGIDVNQIIVRSTDDTPTYEIDRVPDPVGLTLHAISIPIVIGLFVLAVWQSRRRQSALAEDPSWLDQLGH